MQLLDKLVAVDSKAGGAPLGKRTLVVFMKLGEGIPYDVVLKEEIDAEIAGKLGRATQGHSRGCKCIGCITRRTAAVAARKRLYRVLKYRNEFGFATTSVSVEQWQAGENFREILRLVQSGFNQSEVALGVNGVTISYPQVTYIGTRGASRGASSEVGRNPSHSGPTSDGAS